MEFRVIFSCVVFVPENWKRETNCVGMKQFLAIDEFPRPFVFLVCALVRSMCCCEKVVDLTTSWKRFTSPPPLDSISTASTCPRNGRAIPPPRPSFYSISRAFAVTSTPPSTASGPRWFTPGGIFKDIILTPRRFASRSRRRTRNIAIRRLGIGDDCRDRDVHLVSLAVSR